ncbi:MAG: HAD hydrolase-like protein [Alphaproteobacteria bacterium]|nr:HAD hydrolase-like protein [Alphaproteobacteria bacterium]
MDSWEGMHRAMNATLVAMGREPWTMEEAQRRMNRSLRDAFPELFGDRWHEAHDVFYAAFMEGHVDSLKSLPGAEEMLKTLHDMQIFMGVASSKVGPMLREEIAHLGWDAYLPGVVGAGEAEKDKPAKEAALFAIKGTDIELGPELWVVGDLPIDVQFARNAGGTAIVMNNSLPEVEEYGDLVPDWFVETCTDLPPFISACTDER